VNQRSEGRCEFRIPCEGLVAVDNMPRCPKRATDHHHLLKPRRSHHTPDQIVHLCRDHHDRCEWPFKRGRLVITQRGGGRFAFAIRYEKERP
jgi:hypothetical protein